MNYRSELKKYMTSQYIYSAVRITLAIVVPSVILAYFGVLKEYVLFPLGTSLIGFTDQPGPFIRRRNSLLFAVICFFFVALVATLIKDFPLLIYTEIIFFGMFFSLIGIYGQRLAAVGSLSLVVLGIFINGHLTGADIFLSLITFLAGCFWFFIVFLIVTKIQPYKLAGQMIGENYLDLADYLLIKAKFYEKDADIDALFSQVISQQIKIKNLQEETRETVFKTRTIVNESTTESRLLMLMFLNSIDLHEKLMTSESDYKKVQQRFGDTGFLLSVSKYLSLIAGELTSIGIAMQANAKAKPLRNIDEELQQLFEEYFDLRNQKLSADNLEDFMILRQIMVRIADISEEINAIYRIFSQDEKLAKSLSTGLDIKNFTPNQEKLNLKVLRNNLSLASSHFRHAIRITSALLIGYFISKLEFLGLGHSYWILITIIAIMRPAYSTTKDRNLLRLYGTLVGAVSAYIILFFIKDSTLLFTILLISMILCFSMLKWKYFWAVLFMTIYVFLTFNLLTPGNINVIFKDRILDTAIGGLVAFAVSYFVLPVWEHTQNLQLMQKAAKSNLEYFQVVMDSFKKENNDPNFYKLKRKNAIINLANLSDNFQRMISDPKNQQKKLETVHQFVNTSHLITAYTASLSQFSKTRNEYPEIDFETWNRKISAEIIKIISLLSTEGSQHDVTPEKTITPEDAVEILLENRKKEIEEHEISNRRDPARITHLTELSNIRTLLHLIDDVSKEQIKILEKLPPQISQQS
ncbi:FUSC family protein [Chryseobacterium sp.]|nr:FUSC family protein [Chryseobacterium sp.]